MREFPPNAGDCKGIGFQKSAINSGPGIVVIAQIHLKIGLVWDLQGMKIWDLMNFFRVSCLPSLKRTAKAPEK